MIDSKSNPRLGRFVETALGGEIVRAFVPPPLPPLPSINVMGLLEKLSLAERALGRLDGITMLLPRQELFLYMYVRKEALLSSQIEGTQSTLSDLLRYEAEAQSGNPVDDIREVSNYVDAMMFGLSRLEELPLSMRLIREMHARLLQSGRGGTKNPGEFRKSQNWIGGTRPGNALFVPPPVTQMESCLSALEKFMHEETSRLPAIIKAGLLHVQFETIHPFLDGNGRIGRLLVTLYLCVNGVLKQPMLYLSLYLKQNRDEYYRLLTEVRQTGDWEVWLDFFLRGVRQTAESAVSTAHRLMKIFEEDHGKAQKAGRGAGSALRVHGVLKERPLATVQEAAHRTGLSFPAASAAMKLLVTIGVARELTGKKRNRLFAYDRYLKILNEGTEPL